MNFFINRQPLLMFWIFGIAFWNLLIWLFPFLISVVPAKIGLVYHQLFFPICHHQQESTWIIMGHYLPVCIRCTSIYGMLVLGSIVYLILPLQLQVNKKLHYNLLGIASLFMLWDVLFNYFGWKSVSLLIKSLSGGTFGFVLGLFISYLFTNQTFLKLQESYE